MIPFNESGQPWQDVETWGAVTKRLRARALRELQARDERLSGGAMNAGNAWTPATISRVKRGAGVKITYIPNPALVKMKHSGKEMNDLFARYTAQFCAEPQDEEAWAKRLIGACREKQLAAAIDKGAAVAESLGGGSTGFGDIVSEEPVVVEKPAKASKAKAKSNSDTVA